MPRHSKHSRTSRLAAAAALLFLSSCVAESGPTAPELDLQTMEARGGKGGGGGGGSITVTSTEPGSLPRGAKGIGLTVRGSGFEAGMDLGFEVDGVESDRITVLGVSVIDESTLIATVDVAEDSPETLYDVAVRNGPKKKGVGIDLLAIVPEVAVPVVAGTPAGGNYAGRTSVFAGAGGRVVGWESGVCGWVYDVEADTRSCISIPGVLDEDVYPQDINSSGRVGGIFYVDGGSSRDERPFVMELSTGEVTLLPVPDGWEGADIHAVAESGLVSGSVTRNVEVRIKRRMEIVRETAFVLWNADLSLAAVSAAGSNGYTGAEAGMSETGLVPGFFEGANSVWDGRDGTTPIPVDDGNLGDLQRIAMRGDGSLIGYTSVGGNVGRRVLEWDSPSSAPRILLNADLFLLGAGEQYGESGYVFVSNGNESFCVDPSGSMTRLDPPAGFDRGYASAETHGVAVGVIEIPDPDAQPGSFGTLRYLARWDVSGGC